MGLAAATLGTGLLAQVAATLPEPPRGEEAPTFGPSTNTASPADSPSPNPSSPAPPSGSSTSGHSSSEPPPPKGETRYELDFADGTSVDLDTGKASREGGKTYELKLDFGRFFTGEKYGLWEIATVAFLSKSQAGYSGCEKATLIQGDVSHLNRVRQDQVICVSTDKGAWAVLDLISEEDSYYKFDVRLLSQVIKTQEPKPSIEASAAAGHYQLDFADGTSVDLDTGKASREGGKTYELKLDFGRFFTGEKYGLWEIATVAFLSKSQAGYSGCEKATLIQGDVSHLNRLRQDQVICVSTDKDAWAVLDLISEDDSYYKFDVRLFRR